MDILACILKIYPDWQGVVWENSYAGIQANETENRKVTLAELQAVWPEVQAEQIKVLKRQAYKTEADPLFIEYQTLAALSHSDAETRKAEWLAKRAEIEARIF